MTKMVKTLKDLKCVCYECNEYPKTTSCKQQKLPSAVNVSQLRQSAIEWIKWIRELEEGKQLFSATNWIKMFFNISEEDLK